MTLVYISLGSNIESVIKNINSSIKLLESIPKSSLLAVSSYYRTSPLGSQCQPDYLNAAVKLETKLNADDLLNKLQIIEFKQGRIRNPKDKWGPRSIDLDIMLFGDEIINTERLIIPHYDIKNRDFMLWPLFEIAPQVIFPDGIPINSILQQLGTIKPKFW